MSDAVAEEQAEQQVFPATVVSVFNDYRIVVNRGSAHDVRKGQRFLLYALGDEITDPSTGQSLGQLEIPKGTGTAIHVQEQLTTIESDMIRPPQRKIIRRSSPFSFGAGTQEEEITPSERKVAFTDPNVGDLVKPLR